MRMPFGINSASEVMQKRNEQTFPDVPDMYIIADHIIIAAKDEKEQDEAVRKVMQRAWEKNIRFNKDKVQYKVSSMTYIGHIASTDCLKVDPATVVSTVGMPTPYTIYNYKHHHNPNPYLAWSTFMAIYNKLHVFGLL